MLSIPIENFYGNERIDFKLVSVWNAELTLTIGTARGRSVIKGELVNRVAHYYTDGKRRSRLARAFLALELIIQPGSRRTIVIKYIYAETRIFTASSARRRVVVAS